jgi:hypothetical protein
MRGAQHRRLQLHSLIRRKQAIRSFDQTYLCTTVSTSESEDPLSCSWTFYLIRIPLTLAALCSVSECHPDRYRRLIRVRSCLSAGSGYLQSCVFSDCDVSVSPANPLSCRTDLQVDRFRIRNFRVPGEEISRSTRKFLIFSANRTRSRNSLVSPNLHPYAKLKLKLTNTIHTSSVSRPK